MIGGGRVVQLTLRSLHWSHCSVLSVPSYTNGTAAIPGPEDPDRKTPVYELTARRIPSGEAPSPTIPASASASIFKPSSSIKLILSNNDEP